jgi:hypothetical protein
MAQPPVSPPAAPAHVAAFNQKVADLVKATSSHELVDVLTHPGSLLRSAAADNQNQNGKSASLQ